MGYFTLRFIKVFRIFYNAIVIYCCNFREEHRQQAQKKVKKVKKEENDSEKCLEDSSTENGMPPSIEILFSAHEFLGNFFKL